MKTFSSVAFLKKKIVSTRPCSLERNSFPSSNCKTVPRVTNSLHVVVKRGCNFNCGGNKPFKMQARYLVTALRNSVSAEPISRNRGLLVTAEQCLKNNTASSILQHLQPCTDNVTHRTTAEIYLVMWESGESAGEWELAEASGAHGVEVGAAWASYVPSVGGRTFISMWGDSFNGAARRLDPLTGVFFSLPVICFPQFASEVPLP